MRTQILTNLALFLFVNISYSSVVVVNGLTHVHNGVNGETITGEIILMNTSIKDQRVTFNLSEAIFSCDSPRVFSNLQSHDQSSSAWYDGNLMDKVLAPKEKYIYKYSIHIPNDETLEGTFWTSLMIEVETPIKEERLTNKIDLDTKVRYAVGLVTNVNEQEQIKVDFNGVELCRTETTKSLKVKISNQSTFLSGVKLSLEIFNKKGVMILELKSGRNMVFPNSCREFNFNLAPLEAGEYEGVLIANAKEEYLGTTISLKL